MIEEDFPRERFSGEYGLQTIPSISKCVHLSLSMFTILLYFVFSVLGHFPIICLVFSLKF